MSEWFPAVAPVSSCMLLWFFFLLVVVGGRCTRWQSIQGEGFWSLCSFWILDAKSWIRLRWSNCRTSRSHHSVKMSENVRKQWQTANRRSALWSWQRETVPKLWLLLVWQWLDATSTGSSPQFLRSDVKRKPMLSRFCAKVFPLRGKLLNVREMNQKSLAENKEALANFGCVKRMLETKVWQVFFLWMLKNTRIKCSYADGSRSLMASVWRRWILWRSSACPLTRRNPPICGMERCLFLTDNKKPANTREFAHVGPLQICSTKSKA